MTVLKSVAVRFAPVNTYSERGGQEYHYLVPDGDVPAIEDIVITSMSTGEYASGKPYPVNAKFAFVTEIHETFSNRATKYYLHRIPRSRIAEQKKQNGYVRERIAEITALKSALEAKLKAQQDVLRFAHVAATDPEAAVMLERLVLLTDTVKRGELP